MRLQAQRAEVKAELAAFSAAQIEELKREATEAEHRMHEERDAHRAAMLKQEQRSDETVSALQAELSAEREERRALSHKVRVLLLLLRRCPCTCVFRCCSSTACDSRYLSPPSPPSPASPTFPFSSLTCQPFKLSKLESGNERTTSELTRAQEDICKLTAGLAEKEEDLRKTQWDLREAHVLQKTLADERTALHAEVAAIQARVTTLEEHGQTLSNDLAVAREQACSSSGELVATKGENG
jgi:hypothetical protein